MANPARDTDDISVAEDILWVYDRLNQRLTESTPGYSPARHALWEWAQDDEAKGTRRSNKEKFFDMAQKAEESRRKHKRPEDIEAVEKQDLKSVAEYQVLIDEAIEQSKYDNPTEFQKLDELLEPEPATEPTGVDFEF